MDTRTFLLLLVAAITALVIAALQYLYKSKRTSRVTMLLAFLRFLSLFLVFVVLINPSVQQQILEIDKPKLAIALDNSSSMALLEQDQLLKDLVLKVSADTDLIDKFELNFFRFDEKLQVLDSLNFLANRTNIDKTLRSLDQLYNASDALLLVTDGNQTVGASYEYHQSKPVLYPIVVGDTLAQEDLKISKVNVNRYSYLNNNFPVEVFVNYNGGERITRDLVLTGGGRVLARKRVNLDAQNNSQRLNFDLKAERVGRLNYQLAIAPLTNEQNAINNRANFTVEVIDEQAKIGVVHSFYHPDIGMLKRAIETNEQRAVTLLDITKPIDLKEYQMLILYQPDRQFAALFEELKNQSLNYLVISGTQTDWPFLNSAQEHFSKSTINQTEFYQAIQNPSFGAFMIQDFDFESLPPLESVFGTITFDSPSESLLFQDINNIPTEKPLLATFTKDDFRGALLLGEGLWRWRSYAYTIDRSFASFDQFINKLVQYLSINKRTNRLELEYEGLVFQNDVLSIAATYFDNNYTVDSRVSLNLSLRNKTTGALKNYPFRRSGQSFVSALSDLESGDYEFTVTVAEEGLTRSGSFKVLNYNIEQQFSYANLTGIKTLANANNSTYYHLTEIDNLIETLKQNEDFSAVQRSETRELSLIDWRWLLGLIALLLSLEWLIRKYFGKI